ncbi:MucBP domain-containing protein [Streptococcus sp. ZY1909104]|uniref:mucin-binding protein n=1 Tax=Streptococcus sp. ZY1909104 TaxID=3233335 RepID=UPI00349F5F3E
MHLNRRDIFKKRKSKVYKNLVSYGQYGVITGITMLTLGAGTVVSAAETSSSSADTASSSLSSTTATTETTTDSLAVSKITVNIEPLIVEGVSFDVSAIPEASTLIANATELQASGATISYTTSPVAGDTVANILVTYADGNSQTVAVPVTVTDQSAVQVATETTTSNTVEVEAETTDTATADTATSAGVATATTETATAASDVAAITASESSVSSETSLLDGALATTTPTPVPVESATFSWQEVPAASTLIANSSELVAADASIAYVSQPTFGMTSASILVTYTDGTSVVVSVPITVTANAVRKTLAAAIEEGSGIRAVETSPNTSGTVTGSLTSTTATTGLKLTDRTSQTVVLGISGNAADYSGGYIEVRIENSANITFTPSPLAGVTATVTKEGAATVIKYTFTSTGLNGGAYYSIAFDYAFSGTGNWADVIEGLNDNNFTVTTTADFYDKDGLFVQHLGTGTHSFVESKNGAAIATQMSSGQVVGYDLNKDGLVDPNPGQVSFYVYTGVFTTSGRINIDKYATDTGILDGRIVSDAYTTTENTGIDAIVSYAYDVERKPGLTLSTESIAAGWFEDATGYHLVVNRDSNPIAGITSKYDSVVPLILDVVVDTPVADLISSKSISVTGRYTKKDGTTYSNTGTASYSVSVPTSENTQGVLSLNHYSYASDSNIIRAYGRASYQSRIALNSYVEVEKAYNLENYSLTVQTNNDNEFFRRISIHTSSLEQAIRDGGVVQVYDETGALLHTFDATTIARGKSFEISEELKVKRLRYEFINLELIKSSRTTQIQNAFTFIEDTFFADWSTIYNNPSITLLTSSVTANLSDDMGTVNTSTTVTQALTREINNIEMVDGFPANMVWSNRTQSASLSQSYYVEKVGTAPILSISETSTAAYLGELYQAYLVDPELVLKANSNLGVVYNWNNTGKDLYYETRPVTATVDPIRSNQIQIANEFVKNGTYEVLTIGYWAEVDPGFVPTDGIDLSAPINGTTITTANSTTRTFTVTLNASEASGVISQVKQDAASAYSFNTNNNEAQNIVDFKVTYDNVSPQELADVTVITSLPRTGDVQLGATTKARNSQFSVYLTGPVTAPAGWTAVYTTVLGTSVQMEAGTWLSANQVTDWSTITAVKFIANGPVASSSSVDFYIDNAVIGGDALQGEQAYLSSASSVGTAAYIESNNVLIEMAREIADGTVTIQYVNEAGEVIATEKVLKNDIKSDYDASNQATYYPTNITGLDGLPYVYVTTDPSSAPNTGTYSETPQVVTHIYKLVLQTATFTYVDVTDTANPVQLDAVDSETGGSGQDIAYGTATRINEYLKQGYELVSNNYTDTTKYDTDATVDQLFTIELRQRVVTIPDGAVPGKPVDPTDPNSPLWPDSVGTISPTETVTRTIEYKYIDENGAEASATVTQTATFTRTAKINLVTGEITYSDWTSTDPELDVAASPAINGYTPDMANVPALTVDADSEDSNVLVIYTPNEQVGTVTYIDETTGATLEVENLEGVTDAAIGYSTAARIAYYKSLGYEFVSDNYPTNAVYDNIDGNSQDYQVVLKHIITPVTPDNPTNPKDGSTLELTRTVTRTIEYKYIDENGAEASATVTQTATFTRTATVDMVTGKVVYADWTSADAELDAVVSPVFAGYTANVLNVPALTVDADSTDSTVLVIYTPNEQVGTVTYIDETTGNTLEVENLTGVTDAAIGYSTADRIAYYESLGYEFVSDNYPTDAVYDNIDGNSQDYQVVLKHIITPITPDNPTNPKDGSTLELTRTVTRTIEYKYIDENGAEAYATVTQTATFTHTATVNMVTGEVTYGDWTSEDAELDAVDSPAIQGYTPNMANVPALTVDADSTDSTVIVIYKPDTQKATISYVDETTGETITVDEVTGDTDSPIGYTTSDRIKALEEQGYELVTDGYPTDSVYDKDGNVDQNFTVTLRQKQVPVDPANPTNPKDGSTLELTRTVTRTIQYKYIDENGQEASATVTQTATFTRTATVNMVTGEVIYGGWASADAELDAVDSPVIDGYTPNLANVPALTVDAATEDQSVVVIYTPDTQKATISYMDETTGQVITVDEVSGDTDSPIGYTTEDRIKTLEEQGYELVTDGYPTDSVYDKDGNVDQNFTVTLRQKQVPVDPTNPTNPKDGSTLELTRTVTRTIEYKYIDENGQEASATVTQTATFTRTATVNMVTGEVTYGDWTSEDAELDAVDSPVIDGYTPNLANVPALTVDAATEDQSVVVIYTPDTQKATITYIDATTGETITVDEVTGDTDSPIGYTTSDRIKALEEQGYELVTDGYPTDSVYDKDGNVDQNFTVTLRQKQVPVDPTDPTNPKDGSTLELTRTVTRTIEYKYIDENGQEASATVTQTATFTRTATVNMVTGEVTYGEWTSEDAELDAVVSPAIDGYTPNLANVPALTVDAATEDQSVVVIYTPDTQKATISYVDETTGQVITVDEVSGDSDSPIGYTTEDRIKALEEQGYELVTDGYPADSVYDKDGNVDQNFTVTLRPKQVPVDPTNPTNPKDGSTLELTRTVTRTIEYKYIDENGQEASATVTQTATFTRTATVNMVTGEVTYGDWTSEDAELDAVVSPAIDGYTPNLANVPALTVDAATEDQSVVVIYTPNTPVDPETPEEPDTPVDPGTPEDPETPVDPGKPEDPETPETPDQPGEDTEYDINGYSVLPNTGQEGSSSIFAIGVALAGLSLAILKKKKKEDDI